MLMLTLTTLYSEAVHVLLQKGIVKVAYEDLPAVAEYWIEINKPLEAIVDKKQLNVECKYEATTIGQCNVMLV